MRLLTRTILLALAVSALSTRADAAPLLQLGIIGGFYDEATETVVSDGPSFTLVALLTPSGTASVEGLADPSVAASFYNDTYYISAAFTPETTTPEGTFTFSGSGATSEGTQYGTPPLDAYVAAHEDGLAPHSIFPTFYEEFRFQFDKNQRTTTYNVEDDPGVDPVTNALGGTFYREFTVTTSLTSGFRLHFDLYTCGIKTRGSFSACAGTGDEDAVKFAPFSHDAESGPPREVPEPGTLFLSAAGLAVCAGRRRLSRS